MSNSDHAAMLRHIPRVASLAMAAAGRDLRAYNAARVLLQTWGRLARNEKRLKRTKMETTNSKRDGKL